jgi:hypothetical protein
MLRHSASRKNLALICVALLFLAAMTAVLGPKGAFADEGVPIKGNFTVTFTIVQNVSDCGTGDGCIMCLASNHFYIEAQGVGDTAKQGSLFFEVQKCFDPTASTFASYKGIFTMTSPNGKDSLTGTYTGKNTGGGDAYGFGRFSGDLKITDGTGKFCDARGHAQFTAVGSGVAAHGTAYYAVDGTVSSRD